MESSVPKVSFPAALPELREWIRRTVLGGSHSDPDELMDGVIAWARKEDDAELFREVLRALGGYRATGTFSVHDLRVEALKHVRPAALSLPHLKEILEEDSTLAYGLAARTRLPAPVRKAIFAYARTQIWNEIKIGAYTQLPQTIHLAAQLARGKEDKYTLLIREELVHYARHGDRKGYVSLRPNSAMQRVATGALFAFPKLPAEMQEMLFKLIIPNDTAPKGHVTFLHEAAMNPDTLPSVLLRVLATWDGKSNAILYSLNSNPTARALPEFEEAVCESGSAELLSERLGQARGDDFRRYFRRFAEVSPIEAIAALSLEGAQVLEPADLLPLATSSDPEVRMAFVRHQGGKSKRENVNAGSGRRR